MSETWRHILTLIERDQIRISAHGYEELVADNIFVQDAVAAAANAMVVEEYPEYHKGPCILVLSIDRDDNPIHVLWGIPKNKTVPAVLITAYRPDPERWSADFTRRKE